VQADTKDEEKTLRLNVGCGQEIRPKEDGWINIDIANFPGVDLICPAQKIGEHFQEGSVDFICCQHLLQFLPRAEIVPFLQTCYRLLKPKGASLEIRVPEIGKIAQAYHLNKVSGELGFSAEMFLSLLYGTQEDGGMVRKSGYTSEFLQGILVAAAPFKINNLVYEEYDVVLTAEKVPQE